MHLQSLLIDWGDWKSCSKKDLIGTLNHACKVVRPGRSFVRKMIDLLKQHKKAHHQIRLNREFRSDLYSTVECGLVPTCRKLIGVCV